MFVPLLWLAGAVAAQTDSVNTLRATDSARLTDSVASGRDSTRSGKAIPLSWLPLRVQRLRPADLDAPEGTSAAAANAGVPARDTGNTLKIAGSKTVKVGVGGNGGVALDQTLYLSATGELSPGVQLDARLSDGDVPLSAQGSSASLREIDQIYLDVHSKRWNLRLGDQDWYVPADLAPGAQRRLRGVSAGWTTGPASARATVGGPQAKWKRLQLQGSEGKQEGYVLASGSYGLHGAVVPGSETVRINGEPVKRGTDADYVVRYAEGLLDFTTRRRISGGDRIEVEFQAADLDYERSFAAGQADGRTGLLRWEGWAVREGDDAASPLGYVPDSTSRRILSIAGSDSLGAALPSGQILPLPSQTGEAGVRARLGDSSLWVAADMRGSDHDRNTVSNLDSRRGGMFWTAAAGTRLGDYVSRGGTGRFTLAIKAQRLESRFRGITATDSLGSGNGGLWAPAAAGGRTLGEGSLEWLLLPGIGGKGEASGRNDATGWSQRIAATLGQDRGEDRQILTNQEWVRRDDGGTPLEQTRSKSRVAWPVGTVVPSLELITETLDQRDSGAAARMLRPRNRSSLETRGGAVWRPSVGTWEIGLQGISRQDAVRASDGNTHLDTARSVGASSHLRWSPALGDLDVEIDGKRLQARALPSLPWVATQSWLGSASGGVWPVPGVRGQASWKLSSSSYQPEIPLYDTVPEGAGTYRYDTLLRVVVPSDLGNLRLAGTRLDTTRPAVLASQRNLSFEGEFEPGRAIPGLEGFLADIGLKGRVEWEETDSTSGTRIWPHFRDEDLAGAITGRSELMGGGWWSRPRKRLDFEWIRVLTVQSAPTVAALRAMDEELRWSSSSETGHRLDFEGRHGDLRDRQPDRLRLESYWSTDPSVGLRLLRPLELRPGWRSKWGEGTEKTTTFRAELQSPYAALRADLPRGLRLLGEVRRVQATVDDLAGSRLSESYPDGVTWRLSGSLDWAWKDHLQARVEWVARKEPASPWFQKLSGEAKATF